MTATVILARRTFSLADQQAFAELSGDWNPLHLDAVASRRALFGEPVVHGIHLVLWALEQLKPRSLRKLRARFRKPAYLDRELTLVRRGDLIEATSDEGAVLELAYESGEPPASQHAREGTWPARRPDELDFEAAAAARGETPLVVDVARSRARFPSVAIDDVAELLAMTRIVGMHCPGLHSVFAALELSVTSTPRGGVHYEVAAAKPNYSVLNLRVAGPRFEGTLETFVRPQPVAIEMAEAIANVTPDAFAGRRALVIGGSRGLGEAFAKALAAGGAEVCLTYHRGAEDAQRVVSEIRAAGKHATVIQADVDRLDLGSLAPPTHLYYFATPTLRLAVPFRAEDLERMIRVYATNFHAAIVAALALGSPSLVAWTPSTIMLDEPARAATAYCMAKAAMEELCRHLPAMLPVQVHAPRLGRLATDHPPALVKITRASTLAVAIEQLARH